MNKSTYKQRKNHLKYHTKSNGISGMRVNNERDNPWYDSPDDDEPQEGIYGEDDWMFTTIKRRQTDKIELSWWKKLYNWFIN